MPITRRQFLQGSLIAAGSAHLPISTTWAAQTPRQLTAALASKRLVPGEEYREATVWAFDQTVPGPMLRYRKDEWVSIDFKNDLPEGSSIHWHGIRNFNGMDGVAGLTQPEVPPGGQFRYEFPLPDSGTYWYHSHAKTWSQVARGLYGPLIIEDDLDPAVDHDLVLMIDDWLLADDGTIDEASFGSLHDWVHGGRLGNWLTVNGESHPEIPVKAGARVRLRLINAANARVFGLTLPTEGTLIAEDGFPRTHQPITEVTLAPAQRADIIVDLPTTDWILMETRNGGPYPAVTLKPTERPDGLVAKADLPERPVAPPPMTTDIDIPLHMQGGAMGNLREAMYHGQLMPIRELAQQHKKAWAFNGEINDHHGALAKLARNQVASIQVFNDTRWEHAMHLHGHHFWIQREDGSFLDGQRDTYLFARGERANLIFIADNPGLWLFHCHMLEHHEAGMAAVIEVA
jgi:FtsP/CotA-like multicopper oxidase with cupredoxin domain